MNSGRLEFYVCILTLDRLDNYMSAQIHRMSDGEMHSLSIVFTLRTGGSQFTHTNAYDDTGTEWPSEPEIRVQLQVK